MPSPSNLKLSYFVIFFQTDNNSVKSFSCTEEGQDFVKWDNYSKCGGF